MCTPSTEAGPCHVEARPAACALPRTCGTLPTLRPQGRRRLLPDCTWLQRRRGRWPVRARHVALPWGVSHSSSLVVGVWLCVAVCGCVSTRQGRGQESGGAGHAHHPAPPECETRATRPRPLHLRRCRPKRAHRQLDTVAADVHGGHGLHHHRHRAQHIHSSGSVHRPVHGGGDCQVCARQRRRSACE